MATKKKSTTGTKRKKAAPKKKGLSAKRPVAKKKSVDELAWEKASEESKERFQPGVRGTGVVVVERDDAPEPVAIEIEADPPRPSGHCFYGVMLPIKLTQVMSDEARRLGIKISRFSDLQWFASCRDFAAAGPVTLTRDMLAQDHTKRLREFCKKAGVPFRAQWVFTT